MLIFILFVNLLHFRWTLRGLKVHCVITREKYYRVECWFSYCLWICCTFVELSGAWRFTVSQFPWGWSGSCIYEKFWLTLYSWTMCCLSICFIQSGLSRPWRTLIFSLLPEVWFIEHNIYWPDRILLSGISEERIHHNWFLKFKLLFLFLWIFIVTLVYYTISSLILHCF